MWSDQNMNQVVKAMQNYQGRTERYLCNSGLDGSQLVDSGVDRNKTGDSRIPIPMTDLHFTPTQELQQPFIWMNNFPLFSASLLIR